MAVARRAHDEEAGLLNGQVSSCSKAKCWFGTIVTSACVISVVAVIIWYPSSGLQRVTQSNYKASTILSKSLDGKPLYFAVVGDWGRQGLYNQSHVAAQMDKMAENQEYSFIISTGDNFYENGLSGIDDPLFEESFTNVYTGKNLQKPWFAVLGNHDYYGDVLAQLDSALILRDSRWHCGREYQLIHQLADGAYVEIFFIDTVPFVDKYWHKHKPVDWRGLLPREEHLAMKLQALSQALESSVATWKIVVGHHPIFSQGYHGDTTELIEKVLPILNAKKVDLYVNGHDHCLEHIKHSNSLTNFITTGGGSKAWRGTTPQDKNGLELYYDGQGFTTFTVISSHLHISYYDVNGNIIHEVDLYK